MFIQEHYFLQKANLALYYVPPLGHYVFSSASNNGITMEGVLMLAEALCSPNNLTEIHIRYSLFYVLGFNEPIKTGTV